MRRGFSGDDGATMKIPFSGQFSRSPFRRALRSKDVSRPILSPSFKGSQGSNWD